MSPLTRRPRRALLLAAVMIAGACTSADAVAPSTTPPPATPHPVLELLDRRAQTDALPDVVGLSVAESLQLMTAAGATAQIIAVGENEMVTAQFPAPGAALPAEVVLWIGAPPEPPPPPAPEPEPTADPAPPQETSGADAAPAAAATPAPAAPAAPAPAAPAEAPPSTPQNPPPASTDSSPPPSADSPPSGRTNIRTVAPAQPGTILSGKASWYGPGFAGRTTACGGVFNPDEFTLATRELRCGTQVIVTGPSGKSVEATVTDWGPAEWTGRRFDLSRATFAAIHSLGAGVAQVTVEVQ